MKFNQVSSIKTAIIINSISKYIKIIVNLLFTAILARILTPEDYGIVAVVTVFTTFFSLFSDMGLGSAVIQNKELNEQEIKEIYSFTVYLAFILFFLFIGFSFPLSVFYQNTVYVSLGCLLSISLLFSTLNMIPNAVLMKQKQFMAIGFRTIIITIVSGIITVILSYLGFKYYAIVIESIIIAISTFFWNICSVNLKFTFKIRINSLRKVSGFSFFQFAFNFVNYFSRNMDNILTGKFMGSSTLGYYDKAYKLMQYPTSNLTHVITPALHPILSEYEKDKNYIYDKYLKIVKFLMIIGIFVTAFCYLAAEEIITILYGEKWNSSIECFRYLSMSIWAQMVSSSTGAIFQSLNRTKDMFIIGTVNSLINLIAIICGILTKNIILLSFFISVCYNLHFFTTFLFLIKFSFKKSFLRFFLENKIQFLISLIMLFLVIKYPFDFRIAEISFLVKFVYLGAAYFLIEFLTGEYKFLIKIIKRQ